MKIRRLVTIVTCALAVFVDTTLGQDVWYVDDDGATGNGCTSWEYACPQLHALGRPPSPSITCVIVAPASAALALRFSITAATVTSSWFSRQQSKSVTSASVA